MLVAEYAILSRETYNIKNEEIKDYNLPEGWLIVNCKSCGELETLNNSSKSIWGNCYVEFINDDKKEIVLSIRGTDNIINAIADIGLALSSVCQELSFTIPGQQELESFVQQILSSDAIRENNYSFKIIGHSLGGVMAELAAVKYGVDCITFESPGSLHIMRQFPEEYPASNFRYVTNYLGAPNIINTLNKHPGTIYRMFLPHVEGIRWLHVGQCLLNAIYTASSYVFLLASPAVLLCSVATKELLINIIKQSFLTALSTKLLNYVIDWSDEIEALGSQHSIVKIADFLLNDGDIIRMHSWPIIWNMMPSNKLLSFIKETIPLQKDLPGIRNIFDENGMKEAQISRSVGYVEYREYPETPNSEETTMFNKLLQHKF